VDNERVGARTFRDRITDAGQGIVGYGIGERKGIGRVAVVLVLLAACDGKVREAAHVHSTGAGDVREHAVENALAAVIGVETSIDEVADAAAGLRPPPRVGLLRSMSRVQ